MHQIRRRELSIAYNQIQAGRSGLAIDIDDTLAATTQAFYAVLERHWPSPNAPDVEQLRKSYALHGTTPHWGDIPKAKAMMLHLSSDPEFSRSIPLFKGVPEFYTKLGQSNLLACYATARVEATRDATVNRFIEENMPDAPLVMRPNAVGFDKHTTWKRDLYLDMPTDIRGVIDNDARLARLVEQAGVDVPYFLFGLSYDDFEPEPNSCVIPTPDLHALEAQIKRHFL